jgi:hypothetical protein
MSKLMDLWSKLFIGGRRTPAELAPAAAGQPTVIGTDRLPQPRSIPLSRGPMVDSSVSRKTLNISEKMAALREALDFEQNVQSRLDKIHSSRDLLIFLHEVLLFKFFRFREIGLLSPESSKAIEALNRSFETVLVKQESSETKGGDENVSEILRENEVLRKQLDSLREKRVTPGIISQREIALDQETDYLKRRNRELTLELGVARKKGDAFLASQEMIRGLRAKNSLLSSKVEHQANLLRALAADNTKNQEYLASIEKVKEENILLKSRLAKQSGVLDQLQQFVPEGWPSQGLIQDLIVRHRGLLAELDDNSTRFEAMASRDPEKGLAESYERSRDENIHIKNLIETNETISNFVAGQKGEGDDPEQLVEILRSENQRLEQLLASKKEQIKVLATDPSNRGFIRLLRRIKEENNQLARDNAIREDFCRHLEQEKNLLQGEVRKLAAQAQQARQMQADIEYKNRLLASLKKVELKYEAMKKKYVELNTKYEGDSEKYRQANKKIERLTTEYNLLLQEYENLFGSSFK